MKKFLTSLIVIGTPFVVFAATNETLAQFIREKIIGYLNVGLELLMAVAVVMFIFYIVRYFITPNDKRKEAGLYLLYSLLGFFIIFSFWGLVNILQNTFNLSNSQNSPSSWSSFGSIFPSK